MKLIQINNSMNGRNLNELVQRYSTLLKAWAVNDCERTIGGQSQLRKSPASSSWITSIMRRNFAPMRHNSTAVMRHTAIHSMAQLWHSSSVIDHMRNNRFFLYKGFIMYGGFWPCAHQGLWRQRSQIIEMLNIWRLKLSLLLTTRVPTSHVS